MVYSTVRKGCVAMGLLFVSVAMIGSMLGCCPTCDLDRSSEGNIRPISQGSYVQGDYATTAFCALAGQEAGDFDFPFCRVASDNGTSSTRSLCSGTLIDRNDNYGLVITCAHCTRGGGPYHVRFCDGSQYAATLLKQYPQQDVAALRISRPGVTPVKCGSYDGKGTYYAYGFGGNGELSCVSGKVTRQYGEVGGYGHSYAGIEGKPISGDSGSGTVNSSGEFVGVLWGHNGKDGLITMGTPVSEFIRSLVTDGKWEASETFTPGGELVRNQTYDYSGYGVGGEQGIFEQGGYSGDCKSRAVVDEDGNVTIAYLTASEVELAGEEACLRGRSIGGGLDIGISGGMFGDCPGCRPQSPGKGDEPGRTPIRSPFDGPLKPKAPPVVPIVKAVAEVPGIVPVLVAAGIAALVAAFARYMNE